MEKKQLLIIALSYTILATQNTTAAISQNTNGIPQSSIVTVSPPKTEKQILPLDMQQIRALMNQGKLVEAKIAAINYLKSYPKDVDMQLILGTIYYKQKDYLTAQKILIDGLKNFPRYTDIRLLLITVDLQLKQYSEVLTLTNEGLKIDPNNKDFFNAKEKALQNISHAH